jgi:CRP/FNR family cyclic AMP-dependent transcriptional regulator
MVTTHEVAKIKVLSKLSVEEQGAIAKRLVRREFRKNTKVISFGAPGNILMFIVSGSAAVVRSDKEGRLVTICEQKAGDLFGELALLVGNPRSADVITTSKSVMLELSHEDFIAHARVHGGLTFNLCRSLAEQLVSSTHRVADLVFCDVTTRLLHVLEKAAVIVDENRRIVRERPTHDHLASLIGSSREVVSRSLAALERTGRIEQEDKTIWLYI